MQKISWVQGSESPAKGHYLQMFIIWVNSIIAWMEVKVLHKSFLHCNSGMHGKKYHHFVVNSFEMPFKLPTSIWLKYFLDMRHFRGHSLFFKVSWLKFSLFTSFLRKSMVISVLRFSGEAPRIGAIVTILSVFVITDQRGWNPVLPRTRSSHLSNNAIDAVCN